MYTLIFVSASLILQVTLASILVFLLRGKITLAPIRKRLRRFTANVKQHLTSYPVDLSKETWESYIVKNTQITDTEGFLLTSVDKALAFQALEKFEFEGPVPPALWSFVPDSVQESLREARDERNRLRVLLCFYVCLLVASFIGAMGTLSALFSIVHTCVACVIILIFCKDRTFPDIVPPSKTTLKKHIQQVHRVRLEVQEGQITMAQAPSQGGGLTIAQAGTGELEVCK